MKILGLIPARGGSKGLPGKNLKPLGGRPLIAHSIAAAREAGIERLLVSTDSPEIARAARAFGAEVPWLRPAALATDKSLVIDAVIHALDRLAQAGDEPDAVLLLQPTSPLRSSTTIRRAIALFKKSKGRSVVSVAPAENHPHWCFAVDKKGKLKPFMKGSKPARRQDLPAAYTLDGAVYIATAKTLRKYRTFRGPGTLGVVSPENEVCDIDTEKDWETAQRIWKEKNSPASAPINWIFIIAEAGVNHNGDLDLAKKLIDAAKQAGADAVKFQSFNAASLASASAELAPYQKAAVGAGRQRDMIAGLELDARAHRELFDHARRAGIQFLSTPFDAESADLLDELGVALFKLPSGEITHRALLEHVARKGKPIILSTGMSDLAEVERALGWIAAANPVPVTLLHCVTEYPAPPDQVNLRAMKTMRRRFQLPVGYSDHTLGIDVAVAAVAMGATVIEKHLTLDRGLPGPDHQASLEPAEFARMVEAARLVASALGDGVKKMAPCEAKNRDSARRSLVAARDLPAGRALQAGDLAAKRPGTGISPAEAERIIGKKLRKALRQDELVTWEAF